MNIKDFKWTEKRFGTHFATILKKLVGLSKDGTDGSIEYKDEQGNVTKLVTDSTFSSLLAKNGLIEVKWQELKDKRDNGQLIPGSLYRITDYNCTTTQENTRSAGHQFDIVLLALSENKLAEEGWAMMNESNIYDITFGDGVTKKCWVYSVDDELFNFVDIDTLLGVHNADISEITIDVDNKTVDASGAYLSTDLTQPNLTYNYFQNSNLSAWKVWYCLDNDTSRFAWADDGTPSAIWTSNNHSEIPYYRDASNDIMFNNVQYYAWHPNGEHFYTTNQQPSAGDILWREAKGGGVEDIGDTVTSFVPASNDGRGVIYRLIDEWNNDVPYDFKNIQYIRPLTDGVYDAQGVNTWCYTFNAYNSDDEICYDATMINDIKIDDGQTCCKNNYFSTIINSSKCRLGFCVVYCVVSIENDEYYEVFGLRNINSRSSFVRCFNVTSYFGAGMSPIEDAGNSIYIYNKKVLTEE